MRQQRISAVEEKELNKKQYQGNGHKEGILLVVLFEAHGRKFGLLHGLDTLNYLVKTNGLEGGAHIKAIGKVGNLAEHLLVELRDNHLTLFVTNEVATDADGCTSGVPIPIV